MKINKNRKPRGYWNDESNVCDFLFHLQKKLNLNSINDWDSLSREDILANGGRRLFNKYSLHEIKCLGFPEGKSEFSEPRNQYKTAKFWEKKENVEEFMKSLQKILKLNNVEDWNSLNWEQIRNHGGGSLANFYSLYKLKCIGYPDGKLIFSKPKNKLNLQIKQKPAGYWKEFENVQNFLTEFKEKYNLISPDDWNLIKQKQFIDSGGVGLLKQYSLHELKCIGCPDGKLIFNRQKPAGYWKEFNNVQNFLIEFKEKNKLKSPDDWNLISSKQIKDFGGSSLFSIYSLYDLKCIGCPEGKYVFNQQKSSGFWKKNTNVKNFLNNLENELDLKSPEDWKRISREQIQFYGGRGLLSRFSMKEIVERQNLSGTSNPLISSSKRSSQRWLFLQVKKLFPGEEIVEDYFHSEISRKTGYPVQFDIFLINKKIAFEYHGKQHFEDIPTFGPIELSVSRDFEKQNLCNEFGIKLFIIPFWWDNTLTSLRKTCFSDSNIE